MTIKIGLDMGRSSVKLTGAAGSVLFPSMAALIGLQRADMIGRSKKNRPMVVEADFGEMFVGHNAHRHGQPLENFSFDQLANATDEMRAILFGTLTEYQRKHGAFDEPLEVVVGLPYQMLEGDADQVAQWNRQIKNWIGGEHHWKADGAEMQTIITRVSLAPQAFGVVTDYVFDMLGNAVSEEHSKAMKMECAAISIGSSTVELQVTWKDADTKRFCGGKAIGVRWLKSLSDPKDAYYFGEWNELLEAGELPDKFSVDPYLNGWWTEVDRFLDDKWKTSHERFFKVFVVGGGSMMLKQQLTRKFNGRAVFFSDPIMAISRGLYKAAMRVK